MQEVKDHLGHSSITVTSDRYEHLFPDAREARAMSLEDLFRTGRTPHTRHEKVFRLPLAAGETR
jgi:hypothetical protein